jgi:glycosyltransferase involved in cell wall biosynthesis
MTTPRRRVLVSAFACGPGRASEPGVGWNTVREIARDHDVWVLTSLEHGHEITAALPHESPTLKFVFLDWPKWLWWLVKTNRIGFEIQHYCWQIAAYLKARELHREIRFDLAHHVTVCRYWMPSFLPLLGIPFVWGPVGGGESAPKQFWRGLGPVGALAEAVREVARFIGERDPLLRLLAKRVTLGVATTRETAERMRKLGVPALEICSQVALTDSEMATLGECGASPAAAGIRFISIARLVAWKGVHLGLHAFARTVHPANEYWIVGGGPAEGSLKALAERLGIASRVRFLGQLPRHEVLQIVQQCDVLVHPSLHESGGAVCAEVMAAGRPVICLDLGGPGLQVTSQTGIKVPARGPEQAIEDIAAAMNTLARSPETRLAMGRAARARVANRFTTAALRSQFTRWYHDVTAENTDADGGQRATVSRWIAVRQPPPAGRPSPESPPIVTAVMPTYNKGQWLQEAIDSILGQTFTDWELIIIDDGSTDDTATVLARYADPRITIRTLTQNVGRARARNLALELARGRYIAICDSDDISAPTRFEDHVAFLDANPQIGVVSSHMRLLSVNGCSARIVFPLDHETIARRFARGKMGVGHGASMIRAECFQQLGGYCEDLRAAEDFELFRRFSTRCRFETLPKDLLLYRTELGAMAFPAWTAVSCAHRYALYRSKCHGRSTPVLSFDEFVQSWRTKFFVYSVDWLRFAHFNLRAHVFSSHVLR